MEFLRYSATHPLESPSPWIPLRKGADGIPLPLGEGQGEGLFGAVPTPEFRSAVMSADPSP